MAKKNRLSVALFIISTCIPMLSGSSAKAQCTSCINTNTCGGDTGISYVISPTSTAEFDARYNINTDEWEVAYTEFPNINAAGGTLYVRRFNILGGPVQRTYVTEYVGEAFPERVRISDGFVALTAQTVEFVLGFFVGMQVDPYFFPTIYGLIDPLLPCDYAYKIMDLTKDNTTGIYYLLHTNPGATILCVKADADLAGSCDSDKVVVGLTEEEIYQESTAFSGNGALQKAPGGWHLTYELVYGHAGGTLRHAWLNGNLDVVSSRTVQTIGSERGGPPLHALATTSAGCSRLAYVQGSKLVVEKLSPDLGWSGEICGSGSYPSIAVAGPSNDVFVSFTSWGKIYISKNGSEPSLVGFGEYSQVRTDGAGKVLLFYTVASGSPWQYELYAREIANY